MEKVFCDKCKKQIKRRKDLKVATTMPPVILRKYHDLCFAKLITSNMTFLPWATKGIIHLWWFPSKLRNLFIFEGFLAVILALIVGFFVLYNGEVFWIALYFLILSLTVLGCLNSFYKYNKYKRLLPNRS